MSVSVNSIPSINVPFTDSQGRINPIWHEFLRKFVSSTVETIEDNDTANINITAGAGLTGGGDLSSDITLTVGAGSGIAVNADDVAVDITGQSSVQATLDDEVMIADVSDNNNIRKTRVREIAALASNPGGDAFQLQYNANGIFGGDTGFTTDGLGSIDLVGDLTVDNINLNGNAIITSSGDLDLNPNGTSTINAKKHIELDSNTYIYGVGGTPSTGTRIEVTSGTIILYQTASSPQVSISSSSSNSGNFTFNLGNGGSVQYTSDGSGVIFNGGNNQMPLRRSVSAALTASTTQTQGQGALTKDINEVSTCANANDTVTLPSALAGRHCLVINNGAQTLQVFPASGDDLGAGVDTSTTITSGSRKLFIAYDATNWEPVI